ncbi:MAG: DUF2341 domain-containing protein, partial [Chitinispirillaceae bacterium]|nr:DUF2341 domain-containing protein [Chitinispirillaceae bacterium]
MPRLPVFSTRLSSAGAVPLCALLLFISAIPLDALNRMYWGSTATPSNFWVRNMPVDSFGDSYSRQFFLSWKMDSATGINDGEIHRFKTSRRSPFTAADTGSPNNLLPASSLDGTLGYVQIHTATYNLFSNRHAAADPEFSVPESSATRVILKLAGRKIQNMTASCSLMTQWTVYPTGQVFRYDSIYGNTEQIDSIQFRFYQKHDAGIIGFGDKFKARGGISSATMIQDLLCAFLTMRDNTGPVANPFASAGDTVMMQQLSSISSGIVFRESSLWPAANKPYEMAFYMDIQHENLASPLVDSIANGIQYIGPLAMVTGTAVTTTSGDVNGDGFNEREGAYVVSAISNTVHFKLPAHGDTCRFYPAFRITNYTAGVPPAHVAVDSMDLVEGVNYNAYVNSVAGELVIQFGMVARDTADIYLSAAVPLEDYSTWPYHHDFILNTKASGANVTGDVFNFPVLVRINQSTFVDFPHVLPGGADIRFAKSDGRHLAYDIERWVDGASDKDTAEIWVKLDTVRGNDSTQFFRMYYGKSGVTGRSNSGAVFNESNGFSGVYHFSPGSGAMNDATGRNPALNAGSVQTTGPIGSARGFNGSSQYLTLGTGFGLNPAYMTIAAWVNGASFPETINNICSRSGTPAYRLAVNSTAKPVAQISSGATQTATDAGTIATSSWHHLVFSYDGSMLRLYRNGTQTGSTPGSGPITPVPSDTTFIGKGNTGQYWNGLIDEIQISATDRSPDWIQLCYENQKQSQALVDIPPGKINWVGGTNAQWGNPANWSPSRVPKGKDTALFASGAAPCSLMVNDTVGAITFTNGYSGVFAFNNKILSVSADADCRSGGLFISPGSLQFIGSENHSFIPHAGVVVANQIIMSGTGVTTVAYNGIKCGQLTIPSGTMNLAAGLIDSVYAGISLAAGATLDFGSSTVKFSGISLSFASSGTIIAGTGTLDFCKSTGNAQTFIPQAMTEHPAISHTGSDTLRLSTNPLRAKSFSQSAGTLDLNNVDIDTLIGDLTITNGTSSSLLNLAGRTIKAGGNATLSGQSGNLLNLAPGANWNLKAGGTLTAGFAAIGNCTATGAAGTATNSYDLGGNSNWASITGNPRIEPGASNLSIGGGCFTDKDSIPLMHLRMLTSPAEGAYVDTIRAKMTKGNIGAINYMRLFADIDRNGTFNPPTDSWIKDTTVTVADSSICFARGAVQHLDSLDVKDTAEYWLVMDLNNATLSSTDTFMFSATPSLSTFRGKTSSLEVSGGGSMVMGDTAWGMQGGLTLAVGDSNGVIGKPVITDEDSILCMHFTLSATSVEKVYLDTMRVRMSKGNRMAIDKVSLSRDDGTNGSYEPTIDSLVWETTVATDSVATFWQLGGFDSVAASASQGYWFAMNLNSNAISAADTFQFSLNAGSMVIHGASSNAGFPVEGGTILGDTVPGDEAPYVNEVTASTLSGSYGIGATITITVIFSKNVNVAGGVPVLTLETGTTDREATYSGGSGTNTLIFTYTVMAGDAAADLDYISGTSLDLSGATIKDAGNHDASVLLPTPGTTGSLGDTKDIRIDGTAPTVAPTCLTSPNGGEVWAAGTSQSITWNTGDISDVLL